MPGRNAKPISLHLLEGNPNRLTKDDIKNRQEAQIVLGDNNFITPSYIKRNKVAYEKWLEVIDIYNTNDVDFATSSDTTLIARYCMTYSEYIQSVKNKEKILKNFNEKKMPTPIIAKNMNKLQIENGINKKSELLLKMEGQLFLTPLSKVKNIPTMKPDSSQENFLDKIGFGDV